MPKFLPFQKKELNETAELTHVGYFWDMGLGKTFVGAEKAQQLENWFTLVICQKSKIRDWLEHFEMHTSFWIELYDLTDKSAFKYFLRNTAIPAVGVINYELAWRRPELRQLTNFTLLLDESSQIQNSRAKRTKFVMGLKPKNVILLSGTPVSGKYENLWSQCKLLGWNLSQKAFDNGYVNWRKIDVGGMTMKIVDTENPYKNFERLKRKMSEFGARWLKTEEVYDLPAQNFIKVNVENTKEYKKFEKTGYVELPQLEMELIGDTNLAARTYARMLCAHLNPHKIQAFKDLLESTKDRLVVFYNWDAEVAELVRVCQEVSPQRPVAMVRGGLNEQMRYDSEEGCVLFVQYRAGAMGLNLQKGNKIIYFSLTDDSSLFEQSKKRIHRIGQEMPCFYWLLVCKNTIESDEILPTLNMRKEFTDKLFEREIKC